MNLPTLSIKQPWAWLICNGGKDIENRSWPTRFRGRFLVHASAGMTRAEYQEAQRCADDNGVTLPPYGQLQRGGIVGEAEIVDCVNHSESPWFFGEYGFVLRNAKPLPFLPYKGTLGFWNCYYPESFLSTAPTLPTPQEIISDPNRILELIDECPKCKSKALDSLTWKQGGVTVGCWNCGWHQEPQPTNPIAS